MSDQKANEMRMPDPKLVQETMEAVVAKSQRVIEAFVEKQKSGNAAFEVLDPQMIAKTYNEWAQSVMKDPAKAFAVQMEWWQQGMALWLQQTNRMLGKETEPVVKPQAGDKRFADDVWQENPLFDYLKQSYLLTSRYLHASVGAAGDLDDGTRQKLDFYTRQFVDAMAPTNFAATNPKVLKETIDSGGENLLRGLNNLLDDLERGKGKLRIRMTDLDKFKLGENVAVTPGKVIYQNDLMQLIQYTPTTEKVYKRPLLIIPPWINKFYILDLRAKNSFVKWAVEQGHTVFIISWINPDARLAEKGFDDYLQEGPLAALDAIEKATGEKEVKAIGFCLGGTLLATTLAYLEAKGEERIKAATFFTTMIDFEEVGELGVFIDEDQLQRMEAQMEKDGYFEGHNMAEAFNLLRANDLIWSFVVNNYLLGKEPFPFDLLYWNSDSTRMPANMHSFYLRNMYQHNRLCKAGGINLLGTDIDLRGIKTPVYLLSTREDHIAPWKSTYRATQIYQGPIRFVLGASGHIAGVINPPSGNKYGYWVNDELPADPDDWLAGASEHAGSWWVDWQQWVKKHSGKMVEARQPGEGGLPAIEDAPGSYVKITIMHD